jgi:O-antigen/teichoic acid export membrane protein
MYSVYTNILLLGGLIIAFFSKEIFVVFVKNTEYHQANSIVPIIVLSYCFIGLKNVASIGLYLKNKTKIIALTTIIAAILNIILNIILIPIYGMFGAAYATLFTVIIYCVAMFMISDKIIEIKYKHVNNMITFIIACGLFLLSQLIDSELTIHNVLMKMLILLSFPVLICFFRLGDLRDYRRIFNQIITRN